MTIEMTIEQTNQLILLILNSVLMMLLSAALLGGAWLRQNMLSQQLHQLRAHYQAVAHRVDSPSEPSTVKKTNAKASLKRMRSDRQRLNTQYLWSHIGMLMLHVVLLVFSVSLLALALRSLFSFDSLISAALVLFTIGTAGLLAGTGCILIDLMQGNSGGDSLGHSIGKAMTQIKHQWKKRKTAPVTAR